MKLLSEEDESKICEALELAYPRSNGRRIFNRYCWDRTRLMKMIAIAVEFGKLNPPVIVFPESPEE